MILLFSDISDQSTNKIIDWLSYYNRDFIRVNEDTMVILDYFDLKKNSMRIKVNGVIIESSIIKGYWYRRGVIPIQRVNIKNKKMRGAINEMFIKDQVTLRNFIYYFFEKTVENTIGSYFNSSINKLYQLSVANEVGLSTPSTILAKNHRSLNSKKSYITKSLSDVFQRYNSYTILNYTNEIKDKNESFFTSLIQENIEKLYEIRIFYLNGKCYSMAIFSQNNKRTTIDFRRYDQNLPNRNIPYKIPSNLKKLIILLMKKLNLNTGSLDFIYSKNKEYIFLEVNPVGQFGMVSYPCNYELEKVITKTLIQ